MSENQEMEVDSQQEDLNTPQAQPKTVSVSRSPPEDMQNATYSFTGEDHTLGNIVRNQIVKNKHVEFCAYSVPHPSEQICNIRI